jgi:hypothetical protein
MGREPGWKQHVEIDRRGVLLTVDVTSANQGDQLMVEPALGTGVPVSNGRPGVPTAPADQAARRPSWRSPGLPAGTLHTRHRRPDRAPRRRVKTRLSQHRQVVKQGIAWLTQFRCLAVRYELRADIHLGFLMLFATESVFQNILVGNL